MEGFENARCNLCNSDVFTVLYSSHQRDFQLRNVEQTVEPRQYLCTDINNGSFGTVVKCKQCGLIYANPRLKYEIARNLYANSRDDSYIKEKDQRIKSFQRIARECEKFKSGGLLLDIGCYCGFFLEAVSKDKWKRSGVELNKEGIKYNKDQFGIEVFDGDLLEANYPDKTFDLITMWDVIEHLYDPQKVLTEINRILKDDGVICFVTPNINSLMARVFKQRWWFLLQSHVYYFTPDTMKRMLYKAGFEVIKIGTYGRSFTLAYWSTKIEPYSRIVYKFINAIIHAFRMETIPANLNLGDHMVVFAKKHSIARKEKSE